MAWHKPVNRTAGLVASKASTYWAGSKDHYTSWRDFGQKRILSSDINIANIEKAHKRPKSTHPQGRVGVFSLRNEE
jgi:hypothetical protein